MYFVSLNDYVLFRVFCFLITACVNSFFWENTNLRQTITGVFFTLLVDMAFPLQGYVCTPLQPLAM